MGGAARLTLARPGSVMGGQGTPHGRLLARSARAVGFIGEVVRINLTDGPVAVTVDVDEHEHERRMRAGLGAITDREVVTALWELPHAMSVESSAIPSWAHTLIDRAPEAAISADGNAWVRMSRPPLKVTGAIAVGRSPERLVRRVGQLSAVAPMAVVLQGGVERHDPWLLNTSLYGMGVAQSRGGTVTTLSMPDDVTPTLGPYRWWICEMAYERLGFERGGGNSSCSLGITNP